VLRPDSSAVKLVDGIDSGLLEQLEALCHTGGPGRVSFSIRAATKF